MQDKIAFVQSQVQRSKPVSLLSSSLSVPEWLDGQQGFPELEAEGIRLLKSNKVAIVMVAGGLSTRMGSIKQHRGNLCIGPVTSRTIFELQGAKVAALHTRYGSQIIWLVMTSPEVHEIVIASFERANYFGFPRENLYFFQQKSFPILDSDGNPVIFSDGKCLVAPAGHGGLFEALQESGILDRLLADGIEHLLFFQYPNVLEKVFDPVMLGYHHVNNFDVTIKAVTDYAAEEPLGKCVVVDGCVRIIEYYYFNTSLLEQPLQRKVPASIGTYVWRLSFIKQCSEANVRLPFHVLPHRPPMELPKSAVKIEQFIFDLLVYSSKTGVVVGPREEEYAPVKTQEGIYSLEAGRQALSRLYCRWLVKAGGILPNNQECIVEISPHFALDWKDLLSKIPADFIIQPNVVLF